MYDFSQTHNESESQKERIRNMNYQTAYQKLEPYHQTHLLRFFDELTPPQQQHLLHQIEQLDLEPFAYLEHGKADAARGTLQPLGACTIEQIEAHRETYQKIGLDAIRAGKVGCVLLAGGQGSRLGFEHPKGTFNIGKTRTLYIFECLIQNLMDVVQEAGVSIPLLIMTSQSNDAETKAFFEAHQYFGYDPNCVHFFIQEMAPAVDAQHKILMNAKDNLILSPNGNGGWFSSMQRAGMLNMLDQQGIEWLNVFAVDNVLQRMADPCFLGATIASGCASGAKVVAKADPDERVGVLCLEDGKPSIVEYYEMTDELRTAREPDGRLSYNYGVILNYLFQVSHLEQTLQADFPLHLAHKKIAHLDENGNLLPIPEEPNGFKLETLVLDMVHMQESCLSYEVVREKEFAPVKNKNGVDSVETAQALLEQNGIQL